MYEAKQNKEKVSRRIDGSNLRKRINIGNRDYPNHRRSPFAKFNNIDFIQLMSGFKVKGEKGEFIGSPAHTHIHIVGNNTHIIVRGKRIDFDLEDITSIQKAYAYLEEKGKNTQGYDECKKAFCDELGINESEDNHDYGIEGDKSDAWKYKLWQDGKIYLETDVYGIPKNPD